MTLSRHRRLLLISLLGAIMSFCTALSAAAARWPYSDHGSETEIFNADSTFTEWRNQQKSEPVCCMPLSYTRTKSGSSSERLRFQLPASFLGVTFDSVCELGFAILENGVDFDSAVFKAGLVSHGARYEGLAGTSFKDARFHNNVCQYNSEFLGPVDFNGAFFACSTKVSFKRARFLSPASFQGAFILGEIDYSSAWFSSSAPLSFDGTVFSNNIRLDRCTLRKGVSFRMATLLRGASFKQASIGDAHSRNETTCLDFSYSVLEGELSFDGGCIHCNADFRVMTSEPIAKLDLLAQLDCDSLHREPQPPNGHWITFHGTSITDTIHIGTRGEWYPQRFDFTFANFSGEATFLDDGPCRCFTMPATKKTAASAVSPIAFGDGEASAAVILYGPVYLKMRLSDMHYLSLADSLSNQEKRNIVEFIKQHNMSGNENRFKRLELDYMLADAYKPKTWWEGVKKRVGSSLYGYGYRPHYLLFWVGAVIAIFTLIFYCPSEFRKAVYNIFKARRDAKNLPLGSESKITHFIHCFHFSVLVLASYPLFKFSMFGLDTKYQIIVVIEWVIGMSLIIGFWVFSQPGSILPSLARELLGA